MTSIEESLNKLKKDLKDTSDGSLKSEREKTEYTVERIIDFNKEVHFNKEVQQGQGLKILTPQQMISRLSISLA